MRAELDEACNLVLDGLLLKSDQGEGAFYWGPALAWGVMEGRCLDPRAPYAFPTFTDYLDYQRLGEDAVDVIERLMLDLGYAPVVQLPAS